MASNLQVCDISDDVIDIVKKFRLRKEKNIAAIVCKIDKDSMTVVLDERFEDITISELQDELPEQEPRYVVLSYVLKHNDGRVSLPLVFIFISPQGCNPVQQMMYAGTKLAFIQQCQLVKEMEVRSVDEFTEEALIEKLMR